MRFRRSLVLAVLVALFVAALITGWLLFQSPPPPTADEENIAELVFKHAIGESTDCSSLFLSLDGVGDPSDAFMERFAAHGRRVRKGSDSGVRQIWGYFVSYKADESRCKLVLRFAPGSRTSGGEALVYLSTYTTSGLQSGHSYRLAHRDGMWVITNVRLESIV